MRKMVCANCGNDNPKTLFDEDDTFYCSKCTHRTLKATGKDDLVECPYCLYMRDRKAFYCRWCGNAWGTALPTKKEIEETRAAIQEVMAEAEKHKS